MYKRMSCVNNLDIVSILFSSVCQIGDSSSINSSVKVLAVQREFPFFLAQEGKFEDYKVFTEPFTPPKHEFNKMLVINECPAIKVNHVKIIGVSSSSVIHIGSNETTYAEARVLNIRQLSGDHSPPAKDERL
jgi:spore germination protein PE